MGVVTAWCEYTAGHGWVVVIWRCASVPVGEPGQPSTYDETGALFLGVFVWFAVSRLGYIPGHTRFNLHALASLTRRSPTANGDSMWFELVHVYIRLSAGLSLFSGRLRSNSHWRCYSHFSPAVLLACWQPSIISAYASHKIQ